MPFRESGSGVRPPGGKTGASLAKAEPLAEQVATITVSRQSPDDAGIREIFVSVDGEQIAILKNGEAVTHDLPAGPHRLRVHNTLFWKTHEVVLQPGEHARFRAANKAGWGSFGFLMVRVRRRISLSSGRTSQACNEYQARIAGRQLPRQVSSAKVVGCTRRARGDVRRTRISGRLAQLGERRVRNAEVASSSLAPSTNLRA